MKVCEQPKAYHICPHALRTYFTKIRLNVILQFKYTFTPPTHVACSKLRYGFRLNLVVTVDAKRCLRRILSPLSVSCTPRLLPGTTNKVKCWVMENPDLIPGSFLYSHAHNTALGDIRPT